MPVSSRLPLRPAPFGLLCAFVLSCQGCSRSQGPVVQTLSDGTVLYARGDTVVTPAPGFPHPRRLQIDGEVLIKAPASNVPLILSSRLMEVTVTGEAVLRETAFAKQAGEQLDLIQGQAVVHKAYKSNYMTPDSLRAGDMVMVNQTIDLMEKERSDTRPLQDWVSATEQAARPH